MMTIRLHLAGIIREFLSEFAGHDAQDPSAYSSPDATELNVFALRLQRIGEPMAGVRLTHSEWGSGGYKPFTSRRGQALHDGILKLCAGVLHE